ncbi:unnamed protein product [Pylaiella littoralis]
MGKKTKGQDRDKYYHLAKDQGYRARSAFKLIEINKKYDFLGTAKVCIDLCAAPGGWCQVAAKYMPRGSIILGVDLLPIRPIPNVKTLVHDITTDECRTALKREMQTWKADVVLCDGAPNVGTAYKKDAYEQNEIALHALRVATQHLKKGGTFVTKVYRSQDYNSLMWVIQQFFEEHQAVKPASSRSQSAEIFVVGRNYKAPDFIDGRMLEPKHAFRQDYDIEGAQKGLSIFHKKYEQHNKRHRQGYADDLGMSLSRVAKVSDFVESEDPVQVLTDTHVLEFGPDCKVYKDHRATNSEIQHLCSDLRVLGKGDFRHLIKWRLRMVKYRDELKALEGGSGDEDEGEEEQDGPKEALTEEQKEDAVQAEIRALQLKALAQRKRVRKKEREAAARLRSRVAMGMENTAVDLPIEESVFSLASVKTAGDLEAIRDVDLSKLDASAMDVVGDDSDGSGEAKNDADEDSDSDSDADDAKLQEDLAEGYLRFLQAKDENKRSEGTRLAKRKKKAKATKAAEEEMEDTMLYDGDQQRYLQLLANGGEQEVGIDASDVDSSDVASSNDIDSDSDGDSDSGVGVDGRLRDKLLSSVARSAGRGKRGRAEMGRSAATEDGDEINADEQGNPLMAEIGSKTERRQAAAQRWFNDPLFAGVDEALAGTADRDDVDGDDEGGGGDDTEPRNSRKKRSRRGGGGGKGREENVQQEQKELGAAQALMAVMPMTEKDKRKEKRKKAADRKERKESKNSKRMSEDGIADNDLQVVSGEQELENLNPKDRAKLEKKRGLIRAGMGAATDDAEDTGFEVAKASGAAMAMLGKRFKPKFAVDGLDVEDDREYGSDQEPYDDDDRARQLALGTMMLRKHRAKEMVDAAYNRFSWNDDADLPDWFVDDEKKHHRPQVPLPPALLEQMKNKFMSLATKPIKKVAEARARKRKRATQRLANAKKKATAMAANPDMSEREKLKAVQQAMKKGAKSDIPSKVYVVAGKGSSGTKKKGAKIKMVDSRMKSDARGAKRAKVKQTTGKAPKKKKGKGRQGRH